MSDGGQTYDFPIDRSKVREFVSATRAQSEQYQTPDAVVPPTFLTHARLAWEPPSLSPFAELGFDLARLLHGEETYEFHGPPPRVGQTLTVSTRLGKQWEKEGSRGGMMRFAEIINEFQNEAGELVATQTTTAIETGK